jgi:hypothetical protein
MRRKVHLRLPFKKQVHVFFNAVLPEITLTKNNSNELLDRTLFFDFNRVFRAAASSVESLKIIYIC